MCSLLHSTYSLHPYLSHPSQGLLPFHERRSSTNTSIARLVAQQTSHSTSDVKTQHFTSAICSCNLSTSHQRCLLLPCSENVCVIILVLTVAEFDFPWQFDSRVFGSLPSLFLLKCLLLSTVSSLQLLFRHHRVLLGETVVLLPAPFLCSLLVATWEIWKILASCDTLRMRTSNLTGLCSLELFS